LASPFGIRWAFSLACYDRGNERPNCLLRDLSDNVGKSGEQGQFDVMVNGQTVVTRKGGLLAKLLSRPWPEADDVVSAVRAALQPTA
jgi:hypothetical protein